MKEGHSLRLWRMAQRLALVALPLALALALQWPILRHNHVADYDEALHLDCARGVLRTGLPIRRTGAGHVYLNHPPFYLYVLAANQALLGHGVLTGRLLNVAIAACNLMLVSASGSVLSGVTGRRAWAGMAVAAGILAVHPLVIGLATAIHFEILLTALVSASLLAVLWAEKRGSHRLYLLAGGLLGLALLTKALAIVFLGAFGLYHILCYRKRALTTWPLYLVAGPALLLFGLWFVFGAVMDPVVFEASLARWVGRAPVSLDPRVGMDVPGWLGQMAAAGFTWPLTAVLAPALFWGVHRLQRAPQYGLVILYLVLGVVASLVMSTKEVRHLLPLLVPASLLAAGFLAWLCGLLWRRMGGRALASVALLVLLAAISPLEMVRVDLAESPKTWMQASYRWRAWEADGAFLALWQAADWLGQYAPADAVLTTAVSGPIVGYYADRSYDLLYVRDYAGVTDVLAHTEILVEDAPLASTFALPALTEAERQNVIELVHRVLVPVHRIEKGSREVLIHAAVGSMLAEAPHPRPLIWESGVHDPEVGPNDRSYRWTNGHACALAYAPEGYAQLVMDLFAFRPEGHDSADVTIGVGDIKVATMDASSGWMTVALPLPLEITTSPGPWRVCIRSETMVPRDAMGAPDERTLGVMVRDLRLVP